MALAVRADAVQVPHQWDPFLVDLSQTAEGVQLMPAALKALELDSALGAYFLGKSDELPLFDADPFRLIAFAHLVRPFDWPNDTRRDLWEALLSELQEGELDDPVPGHVQDLWDLLFAVVRADRFNEGLLDHHARALARIANELRRRLLGQDIC